MTTWGKRQFSVRDMIGDLVMHGWEHRRAAGAFGATFTRVLVKAVALLLAVLAAKNVLLPTQYESWALWLGQDHRALAWWTAFVLVIAESIVLTLIRHAWDHKHRIIAIAGGCGAALILTVVFAGTWNYYSYTSGRAVGISQAATGGASGRVEEAAAGIKNLDGRVQTEQATYLQSLAATPPDYATAKSRIMRAHTEALAAESKDRVRLEAELRTARSADVTTQAIAADPRPIDGAMAAMMHVSRNSMASAADAARAEVLEFVPLLFVALATMAALSDLGASAAAKVDPAAVTDGDASPLEDEEITIPDLRDEDLQLLKKYADAKRSAAARKGWANRRRPLEDIPEDEVAPTAEDDDRVAGMGDEGLADEAAVGGTADAADAPDPEPATLYDPYPDTDEAIDDGDGTTFHWPPEDDGAAAAEPAADAGGVE